MVKAYMLWADRYQQDTVVFFFFFFFIVHLYPLAVTVHYIIIQWPDYVQRRFPVAFIFIGEFAHRDELVLRDWHNWPMELRTRKNKKHTQRARRRSRKYQRGTSRATNHNTTSTRLKNWHRLLFLFRFQFHFHSDLDFYQPTQQHSDSLESS